MEILVFTIYMLVAGQFIFGKLGSKDQTNGNIPHGRSFYRGSALLNFVIGGFGLPVWQMFAENSVPTWLFYCGGTGLALLMIYAMYCVYKAMTSCAP